MGLLLEIVEGAGAGRRLPLAEGAVELGREAGVVVDDPLVSRRHARVTASGPGAVVEDLGSRNGTFVNGQQLHGPTALHPGDTLQVGTTMLKLQTDAAAGSGATALVAVPPGLLALDAPPPRRGAGGPDPAMAPVERLLDVRVKHQARTAPIALAVLVVAVIVVVLLLRALEG